jgi:tyrosyl-tRNA synthetase
MNKFLNEFKERGYFYQCTNETELSGLLDNKKINAYIGFDSTASSLHVGSLMQIMCLRLLQKHGHRPIVLLGGGTTRIGDPSGKEETRKILSENQIERNIKNIQKVFNILLETNNPKLKPIFVNNYKWLGKLNYINFLREIGKHFTINKMLSFESVKLRLEREQSLSYMEFNYMILQAYDFLELNKTKNCMLQIGGSDQWGNIVNGVELIKRHSNKHVFGLTTPLITLASGAKMGKTEKGAIWLDKKLFSPYDYYQFWRNTDDRDVIKFLKMFTDLKVSEIEKMKNNNINDLKETLALEATKMLHGEKEGNKALKTSISVFVKKDIGNQTQLPIIKIKKKEIKEGLSILDLVVRSKLLKSKGEVRRAIKDKGIKINDDPIDNDNYLLTAEIFKDLDLIKLSHGKKNHVIIKLTN